MSKFVIEGGRPLAGEVEVLGSKNAALPLMAASLLTDEEIRLTNIPRIADVATMIEIMNACCVNAVWDEGELVIRAQEISGEGMREELIGKLRGSILLMGALLGRDRQVRIPRPGGDIIGARPIEVHLDAFNQLGARVSEEHEVVAIDGSGLRAGEVTLAEFSVTATENVLLAAATLPGTTTIHTAAAEPHVVALANLLEAMGAKVEGAGTHAIRITGKQKLHGAAFANIPDMLEAGFFILLAAATKSELTVGGVPVDDLRLFFKKLDKIGFDMRIEGDSATMRPADLKPFRMQALPHPGIATDLQAPFSVLATQTAGSSLVHDPLYESRFKHIDELIKMGADAVVCDPHRVIVNGITPLHGREIPGLDIRSGATLIMAGLAASGTTIIHDAEIVDRGYERLAERLQALGAGIQREE